MRRYEVLGCGLSLAAGFGGPAAAGRVTLRHEGIEAADLGFILYSHGFMVRSDGHCQGPAGERRYVRASEPARVQHAGRDRPAAGGS